MTKAARASDRRTEERAARLAVGVCILTMRAKRPGGSGGTSGL